MNSDRAPTVSVVIPAYGTAHVIHETIASLQAQDFGDWEAIVVDDGSPDDMRSALACFADDPRIQVHHFENAGVSAARNRGIARAQGKYIAFLDSDDRLEPSYLREMSAALDADPGLAFVCCDATMFGVPHREGRRFSEFEPQVPPITFERVLKRQFNVLIAVMVRADTLRAAGGFAEDLAAGEDFDLWLRIIGSGGRAAYIAKPLVWYRRRAGSLSNTSEKFRLSVAEVYRRAGERLPAGDPLKEHCRTVQGKVLARLDLIRGRTALAEGRTEEARRYITGAASVLDLPRWRLMLGLMRVSPRLAVLAERWNARRAQVIQ